MRVEAELLGGLACGALNPERGQPGRGGAGDVPCVGRHEAQRGPVYAEPLRPQVVDARADLEDLDLLDADDGVEQGVDARAPRRRLEHPRLAVREDRQLHAPVPEGLEPRPDVGEGGQRQVRLHQPVAPRRGQVEPEARRRVDERVFGDQPEVPVPAHEAAQQAVLELLGAPALGQGVAAAREQLLAERGHREDVEQGAVGVERERLDALRAPLNESGGSRLMAPRVQEVERERRGGRASGSPGSCRRNPRPRHGQSAGSRAHGLDEPPAAGLHGVPPSRDASILRGTAGWKPRRGSSSARRP